MRRLRAGEWLAGLGGIALIVSLFSTWYVGTTGFAAFTVVDILLAALAALGIALAVLQATRDDPSLPVAAGVLTASLGIFGVLLVLFRIVDKPGPEAISGIGAWLGLVATLAITAGGWLSLGNEHVKGLPPDLEPDLRPAPAP